MGLAQKLLEKMGWKEGEGLGKNRQVRRMVSGLEHTRKTHAARLKT